MQVSSAALGQRVAHLARHVAVFDNHLAQLPALLPKREFQKDRQIVIGWGGSLGHLQDLQHIAPGLIGWLKHQPGVRLEIMADASIAALFNGLTPQQFQHRPAGSLAHYLAWLDTVDIGIAPLLPTAYNRCRSDVKFLEFAAHGAVPVVQRLEPYCRVQNSKTGFLFDSPQQLLTVLNTLIASPAMCQRLANAAHQYVYAERRIAQHVPKRLAFYQEQLARVQASYQPSQGIAEALARASNMPLLSLPGWQSQSLGLAANHHRLDLHTPAEQHSAAGVEAIQRGDFASACLAFAEAVRLDPSDAHATSFLGDCLLRQGRLPLAREALERAIALDPLLSRPVRALARLHRTLAQHYSEQAAQLNPLPALAAAGDAP